MAETITRHARTRMQQRGIRNKDLEEFLKIADIATPIGRGLHAIRVSSGCLAEAAQAGFQQAQIDRFQGLTVIQAQDGALVSCAHIYGRKSKTYLRRDRPKFWRR